MTSSSSPFEELQRERAAALIEAGLFASTRGWLPATSGNLSARLDERHALVTTSGTDKGHLSSSSFLVIDLDGVPTDRTQRASAETALHLALYRRDAAIGAVLHTHSRAGSVLSRLAGPAVVFEGWELQKAFAGVETHESRHVLPIVPNDQDMSRLVTHAEAALDEHPRAPGYLIAGHGLYTWGRSVAEARRHLEAIEFLLVCVLDQRMLGR